MRDSEALESWEQNQAATEPQHAPLPASIAAEKIAEMLAFAGIQINGTQPWDMHVHDERFFHRTLSEGSVGVGESYMEGWWDASSLDQFFARVQAAELYKRVGGLSTHWLALKSRIFNGQTRARSK